MSALATLIHDVDAAIEHGSDAVRARTLSLITDLLIREAGHLGGQQVELFDDVLGRFSGRVEIPARARLAERVADLRNGPPGVIRSLAFDDAISVAAPVLSRSLQLDDQDLMAVAIKGRPYCLAICRRPTIAECVTDVLVSVGDRDVHYAVVGNFGARLSAQGIALLIESARDDETLQISLGDRHDLSSMASRHLVDVTRDLARRQILAGMPRGVLEAVEPAPGMPPAVSVAPVASGAEPRRPVGRDYRRAALAVRRLADRRPLTETDLFAFAAKGLQAEAICTLAGLAGVSVAAAERVCDGGDFDLMLLVTKAQNWSWPTFAALVSQFWPIESDQRQIRRIEARFVAMTGPKARRILQFRQLGTASSEPRPTRALKPA